MRAGASALAAAVVAVSGCAPREPPRPTPVARTAVVVPAASGAVEPLASEAAPALSTAPAPSAPLVEPSTIGDTTCESDADCAITTRADCCECCASQAMATSHGWLAWRDGQCATTRCEPCGKVKCRWFEPESAFRSRCVARSCVLDRTR